MKIPAVATLLWQYQYQGIWSTAIVRFNCVAQSEHLQSAFEETSKYQDLYHAWLYSIETL